MFSDVHNYAIHSKSNQMTPDMNHIYLKGKKTIKKTRSINFPGYSCLQTLWQTVKHEYIKVWRETTETSDPVQGFNWWWGHRGSGVNAAAWWAGVPLGTINIHAELQHLAEIRLNPTLSHTTVHTDGGREWSHTKEEAVLERPPRDAFNQRGYEGHGSIWGLGAGTVYHPQ